MSRLIKIDPQVQQEPEPEGYEYGYYSFDNLPNIQMPCGDSAVHSVVDIKM